MGKTEIGHVKVLFFPNTQKAYLEGSPIRRLSKAVYLASRNEPFPGELLVSRQKKRKKKCIRENSFFDQLVSFPPS